MIEPFTFMIRLIIAVAYCKYVIYLTFINNLAIPCFYAIQNNWWKDKKEKWITNASFFNAIICWIVWTTTCLFVILIFVLAFKML